MQVVAHDNWTTKVNGSSLRGYVCTTYGELVARFGQPLGAGDKVTAEWLLEFSNGVVATIYDWKESETPYGVYSWHIGGHTGEAVELVKAALAGKIPVVQHLQFEEDSV